MKSALVLWLALAAGDSSSQLQALTKRLSAFSVLHGSFTQVKHVEGFDRPLTSHGEFILDRAHGMLWHTEKPFDTKLRVTAHGVSQFKNGQAVALMDAKQRAGFEPWSRVFFGVFSGDLSALQGPFEIKTLEGGSGGEKAAFKLALVPKDAALQKAIKSIQLSGTDKVEEILLHEAQGDTTEIHFSAMNTTAPLTASERAELAE